MTYKAITTYTVAALATAAVGLYSPNAQATGERKERSMVFEFPGAPAGLEKITVSADVNLIPNQPDGSVVVRVGSDELPHRADISVKSVATGKELPVCGYTIQYVVSPATEASQMDPRDDLVIKQYRTASSTPKALKGVEIDYRMEEKDFDLLAGLPSDGKYILYTRGTVSVPVVGTDCTQTLKIPGFSEGPSYDVFTVVGTKGTPLVYDDARVQEWLDNPLVYTKGGVFHPRKNHLVYAEGIMQYEAGPKIGSDFAIMGTKGDPCNEPKPCKEKKRDPCADTTTSVICEPVLFERHYIVGANTVQEGRRTVIVPTNDSTKVTEVKAGEHLVARYVAENYNMRTHEVDGVTTRREDGTLALDDRVVDVTLNGVTTKVAVPMHGDMFAVLSVLYGMTAEDTNHNGRIEATEWTCEPIATKVDYVESVPRGHEVEAFLIGVGVGAIGGYFIPTANIPVPPIGNGGGSSGAGGFGDRGSLIE